MPERINKLYRTVKSEDVQGEGSWVKVKAPTLEDIKAHSIPADGDSNAALDFGATLLGSLVLDWNWVDDDGNPLPPPTPEIVNNLPYAEIDFLTKALNLDTLTDQKN